MYKYTPSGKLGFGYYSLAFVYLGISAAIGLGWGVVARFLPWAWPWVADQTHPGVALAAAGLVGLIVPLWAVWYLNSVGITITNRGLCRSPGAGGFVSVLSLVSLYFWFALPNLVLVKDLHILSHSDVYFISHFGWPGYIQYILIGVEVLLLAVLLAYWGADHTYRPFCEDCSTWMLDREGVYYAAENRPQLEENFSSLEWKHSPDTLPKLEGTPLEVRMAMCPKCRGSSGGYLTLGVREGEDELDWEEERGAMMTEEELSQWRESMPDSHLQFFASGMNKIS